MGNLRHGSIAALACFGIGVLPREQRTKVSGKKRKIPRFMLETEGCQGFKTVIFSKGTGNRERKKRKEEVIVIPIASS